MNLSDIVDNISQLYFNNRRTFTQDIMFLFRNNNSAIPVAELLYKNKLPIRVNNYKEAYKIPIIEDLVQLALLAQNPTIPQDAEILNKVIKEFSPYAKNNTDNPIKKIINKTGLSAFDINYQWKDNGNATDVFNTLLNARSLIQKGTKLNVVFNALYPMYSRNYLETHAFMLEYPIKYYLNLVNDIVHQKTLDEFIQDENEKVKYIKDCIEHGVGVRCYTMHSAKGLEADIVYILDADAGILPNDKQLDYAIKNHCEYEAAKSLRNERSLVYVAVTRAVQKVVIQYTDTLSPLLDLNSLDAYKYLTDVYNCNKHTEMDTEAFVQFCETYIKA